jgi:hypothetical protein
VGGNHQTGLQFIGILPPRIEHLIAKRSSLRLGLGSAPQLL